jgi:hypothetical protein
VEREPAEPAAAHLFFDLATRAHEDRGGAGLVGGDPGAGRLGAVGPPQLDELTRGVDDRDHDAKASFERLLLGGAHDGVGTRRIQDPSRSNQWHGRHAPFLTRLCGRG